MLTPLTSPSHCGTWAGRWSHPTCNGVPHSGHRVRGWGCVSIGRDGLHPEKGKALRNAAPKGWKDEANMEEEMCDHL